jgi:choice-of-anchor A domain-containing protein
MRKSSILFAAVAAVAGGEVQAAPIGLGPAGTFNIYTLGNFAGSNSSVQGAAAAAGNLTASNYSINQRNIDGAGGYALAVGGSLSYRNGSIGNGLYYAGGAQNFTGVGFNGATATAAVPIAFADVSADMRALSSKLATLDATGSTTIAYGGMKLTGSDAASTVFNLSGSELSGVSYFNFEKLTSGDTLVVNVGGIDVTLGGGWSGFRDYNVLFNFYEATSLTFNGVGLYGSVLAPLASVGWGSGSINGNVIVDNWNSNVALNADYYFVPTDVPGFTVTAAVPEPHTWTLLLAGLGLLGCFNRRCQRKPA